MNHIDEPRKDTPGSRAPGIRAKAAEFSPRPTVAGGDNGPAGSAWTTCRALMCGEAGRSVMAKSHSSTGGPTLPNEEAVWPMAEVGGVRSSVDPAPDLWFGENAGERRDVTCSAAGRTTKDVVTASSEATSAQNSPGV